MIITTVPAYYAIWDYIRVPALTHLITKFVPFGLTSIPPTHILGPVTLDFRITAFSDSMCNENYIVFVILYLAYFT